jgi:hypothetical protein
MADPAFRAQQLDDRYAEHVRPVNELVDELRDQDGLGWVPYVAPLHGGAQAPVLSVLRDPGPATRDGVGSGFLCTENDDPTAEAMATDFAHLGIDASDVTPWNAYPWYINKAPTTAQLDAGTEPLRRLVTLMTGLRVVLLQGRDAQRGWRRATARFPELLAGRPALHVMETYHPSRQALFHPDPAVRRARTEHRRAAYADVAALLRGDAGAAPR